MEQEKILPSPLLPERNGKHPQPSLTTYPTPFLENQPEEFNLRQLLVVARRRGVIFGSVALAVTTVVWFTTLHSQPLYAGKFRLLVEPVTADNKLQGLTQNIGGNVNVEQQAGLDYETQIQVLQSPELLNPILQQIQFSYPAINYNLLITHLTISRYQQTKILEITYRDGDPEKIKFILEQLSQGYLRYSLAERQTSLRQGLIFVDKQLQELTNQVDSLQKDLQRFRQSYNFIDPEGKAGQLSGQITNIQQQRFDTEKQLAETRAVYDTLLSSSGAGSTLDESKVYEKLLGQLRDLETQIATESVRFQQDSPMLEVLREKRDSLLPLLRQEAGRVLGNKLAEVANQMSVLQVRATVIAQTENRLNRQVRQLPALARQYTDLQRELKVATESLNRFLEKRQSLQIETAQKEVPWQQIAPPELPRTPVSPSVERNRLLGAIAGILAGIGAALLAERLDNVFHSPDDLKEVIKLPLLGVIPFHKEIKKQGTVTQPIVTTQPNGLNFGFRIPKGQGGNLFSFLEAFRSLHTNIGFLGSDTPIRSLVVSSAVQKDGKSTIAIHLAQAAAAMGQRVLLVDADLRLPQIHTLLSQRNEQGLSNVISTNLPLAEVIQPSTGLDNLFVLTAGQIPPDPTKLLSSKKMQNIMQQLQQEFDFVVYDTPPLLGLADSSLLAAHTDGIALVVRLGNTDRSLVKQALDGLKFSRASVLGLIANGVKNYHISSYNYNYRYQTRSSGLNLSNEHGNT